MESWLYCSYNGSSRQGYTQHMERAVLRAKLRERESEGHTI